MWPLFKNRSGVGCNRGSFDWTTGNRGSFSGIFKPGLAAIGSSRIGFIGGWNRFGSIQFAFEKEKLSEFCNRKRLRENRC